MDNFLITGGGGRIGRAVARVLVAQGARVVLADLDRCAAAEAAAGLGADHAEALSLDVTRRDDVERVVAQMIARHGAIAGLVNAAGGRTGADTGPFLASDPASWRETVDLQFRGVLNAIHAVLPSMFAARRGSIVSIVAPEAMRGEAHSAVYSTAKAAVVVLTETLVRECQPFGVRLNTVLPGSPRSLSHAGANDDAHEIAEAVAFLLSERAARTTGACIDVSGGWALH